MEFLEDRTEHIKRCMARFASLSDEEIRATMAGYKERAPDFIAGEMILQERQRERDPTRPLLASLNDAVATIDGRLATVERSTTRSELRSWSFWIGILALIVGGIALLRDYYGWSSPPASSVSPPLDVPKVLSSSQTAGTTSEPLPPPPKSAERAVAPAPSAPATKTP